MKKTNLIKVIAGALAISTVSTVALTGCGNSSTTSSTSSSVSSAAVSEASTTGSETENTATADVLTAIPLGGDLGDYTEEGATFTQITSGSTDTAFTKDLVGYYTYANDPNYYLGVYRFASDGNTAKEAALYAMTNLYGFSDTAAEKILSGPRTDDSTTGTDNFFASVEYYDFFASSKEGTDNNWYFTHCYVIQDGDDIVELYFSVKCEKTALGDTGLSIYLPLDSTTFTADDVTKLDGETLLTSVCWDTDNFEIGGLDILSMDDSDDAIEQVRTMIKGMDGFVSMTDPVEISIPSNGLTGTTFHSEIKYKDGTTYTLRTFLVPHDGKLIRLNVWEDAETKGSATGLVMGLTAD